MYKTFRFRIYPNDNQIVLINKSNYAYKFEILIFYFNYLILSFILFF